MNNKTPPSLREQIIDGMNAIAKAQGWADRTSTFNQIMFDEAIMPVLQKAMDAGMLLVGRNTKDRVPVQESIMGWLQQVIDHVAMIRGEESVISKRKCLDVIYQFGENAEWAFNEANIHNKRLEGGTH